MKPGDPHPTDPDFEWGQFGVWVNKKYKGSSLQDPKWPRLLHEAIEEDRQMCKDNKWVSVDDRLPDIPEIFLVTDGRHVSIGSYAMHGTWMSIFEVYDLVGVTHWQPLPDPPEVK